MKVDVFICIYRLFLSGPDKFILDEERTKLQKLAPWLKTKFSILDESG